jgi:hypothetical protein
MKPLATPVLGGMVSSLLHVLIVTPVIFFWLRERQLMKQGTATASQEMSEEFSYETSGKTSDADHVSPSSIEKEGSSHE